MKGNWKQAIDTVNFQTLVLPFLSFTKIRSKIFSKLFLLIWVSKIYLFRIFSSHIAKSFHKYSQRIRIQISLLMDRLTTIKLTLILNKNTLIILMKIAKFRKENTIAMQRNTFSQINFSLRKRKERKTLTRCF